MRLPKQQQRYGGSGLQAASCAAFAAQDMRHPRHAEVDSIRVLALPDGRPVKCIEYDSFGNVAVDTKPEWRFPLGFACGLNDHYTGFVRFGFRDYDPRFGRFTARDPIGDTGGDHDLWEYCVDDPVSMNDPSGLESEGAEDTRSWWRRGLAAYSPLLFGNAQEKKAKRESLRRSLEKEARGLAYGFADVLTVYPKQLPSSIGMWVADNGMGLDASGKLRRAVAEDKRKREMQGQE